MMMNIANAVIENTQEENRDFTKTPKTPVKIQMWTTDGNIVKADILGEFVKEMNGDVIAEYVKGDSPIDTRVDADKNLHISIARPAQSYQVDYLVTSFADIYENRDKNITFRPDANTIQSNISSVITKDYAKFETLVDGKYTIYQVDSNNHWSSTIVETTKVRECVPFETLFSDIVSAKYAYVNDNNIIYSMSEKTDDVIRFVNIDNDTRHIWSVAVGNVWTLTDEALCDNKQDKLTAGDNITIENNVISAKGGDAWTYESSSLTANAVFKQYIDQTLTGWIGTVAINVEKDADIGIIRIKNNIDTPIHVSLYNMVTYTLFGVGNKTAYGYVLDIPGNGMLVAKIDHKALYTTLSKYSSGSSTPTETQSYDTNGNPIDAILALSTSLFAKLDIGHCIEVVDQMIAKLKTEFVSMMDKGHNSEQSEVFPNLNTIFSAAYTA